MHHLIDVARYQAVVISLLGKIHIIVVGALVRQLQGTVDVVADGLFLWRERASIGAENGVIALVCGIPVTSEM